MKYTACHCSHIEGKRDGANSSLKDYDHRGAHMLKHLRQFLQRTEAATAVEYAVMLALILMVVIGSIYLLGQNTMSSLTNTNNELNEVGFGS